jgi:hypothetical protein
LKFVADSEAPQDSITAVPPRFAVGDQVSTNQDLVMIASSAAIPKGTQGVIQEIGRVREKTGLHYWVMSDRLGRLDIPELWLKN